MLHFQFSVLSEEQKSPLHRAEDEFTPWYHLYLPPSGGLIRSQQTVAQYRAHPSPPTEVFSRAAQKGIRRCSPYCLAPNGSSLKEEWVRVLGFVIAFIYFLTLPLFLGKVNEKKPPQSSKNYGPFCAL